MLLTPEEIARFSQATCAQPHGLLGMHKAKSGRSSGLVVRAFLRDALACEVIDLENDGASHAMERISTDGLFEVFLPRRKTHFIYQLRVTRNNGELRQFHDPYRFLPTLGDQDLYLFNEGNEHRIYEKLGAHLRVVDGVAGVAFAVWAPAAARVSVVGNFNYWDGRYHPMRPLGASGVWELFIPGLGEGELYKFELRTPPGNLLIKTDPYGTAFEAPPGNASIVCNPRKHVWGDAAWLERRAAEAGRLDRPISIYEVHLASWKRKLEDGNRVLTYRELAPALADYCVDLGFT
ncbi:MAG: 1,4-alpha-glucan branching enzyme, partial [Verrucomicrobia bacterium]